MAGNPLPPAGSGLFETKWSGAVGADATLQAATRRITIGVGGALVVVANGGNITIPAAIATSGAKLDIRITGLVASGSAAHTIFCEY